MKFLIVVLVLLTGCGLFVSEDSAFDAMHALGFTEVTIKNTHWLAPSLFGCSKDDDVAFEVTGVRDKVRTHATVCCGGVFKGCTVRF